MRKDQLVVRGKRGKFIRVRAKRKVGDIGDLFRSSLGKFRMSIEASTDSGAAEGQIVKLIEHLLKAHNIALDQAGPSAHLLPHRKRSRVHEVRPADLYHILKFVRLGF